MARTALITGIRGQDGAYLAQLLLGKGYSVVGADRRSGEKNDWRLKRLGIASDVKPADCDLTEYSDVLRTLEQVRPDEVYNLAAQSFVKASFDQPIVTSQVNALGVLHLLEAIRTVNPSIRFYQASTSEMFGKVRETPQTERTPFHPRSPYGVSKLYGHYMTVNYRESYGMFACCGLLFNHESPLRDAEFVTRKISQGVAAVARGRAQKLVLGNMDAKRDWGYAPEYVEGMWRIIQGGEGNDFVLATGETHTVREFLETAFAHADLDWKQFVKHDSRYERPAEVDLLLGDASKAKKILGWEPKVHFNELVRIMVDADMDFLSGKTARKQLGKLP